MFTIGAVGYLNALPLIHGLDQMAGIHLLRKIPSALLTELENGQLDIALCPVIDAQTSSRNLAIVPAGAIGSRSQALTVRIFSSVPLEQIEHLHVDGDSHTSIALAQVICHHRFGHIPEVLPLVKPKALSNRPDLEAALLIGDKVVTAEPDHQIFSYQLDLGQAWRDLTGLPFVFATWLAPVEGDLGNLPRVLHTLRSDNCLHIEDLAGEWALGHQWPKETALAYLRDLLDYEFGATQLQAVHLFWKECAALGLIDDLKTVKTIDI